MRSKILASLAAGAILVGAGLVTTLVSSPDVAEAQETEGADPMPRGLDLLSQVLSQLVDEGEISRQDADTVFDAMESATQDRRAEHEEIREAIKAALEDGELTEEEASVLPDDHWLFGEEFDEAWSDGVLTVEEIRANRPHVRGYAFRHGARHGFRHGARFGLLMDGGGIDQNEYDSLPEDHPLKKMDIGDALDDGLITPPELRELVQ